MASDDNGLGSLKKWIWEQFIPCTIFAHGKNKFPHS
jgi:hypothetical protein